MPSLSPTLALLVSLRVLGLLLLAPGFSSRVLPWRFRAVLAALLTLLLLPSQPLVSLPADYLEAAWWGFRELLIGFALGGVVRLFVASSQWAGQLIGNTVGLSAGDLGMTEAESGGAPLVRLMTALGIAVYFTVGGHRQLMIALLESYDHFPLGPHDWQKELWPGMLEALGQSIAWSLRIAAPALAAIFIASIVTGMIGRVLPELEIVSWSASANTLVALGALTFSLGTLGTLFPGELNSAWESLRSGWQPSLP